MLRHLLGFMQPVVVSVACPSREAVKLFRVRCEDDVPWQLLHPGAVVGKDIDGIGIDDERAGGPTNLCDEGDGRIFELAQSRSDAQCVEILRVHRLGEIGLLMIHLHHCLGHSHLHDVVVALGCVNRHFARSRPQTGPGCEHCCPCHAVATRHKQRIAHAALVGEVAAMEQPGPQVALFEQGVLTFGLVDIFRREPDVKHP